MASMMEGPATQWFTQELDHFDAQETRTWSQRFFVNDTFFNGTGPIFFQIGGEGAISPGYVTSLEFVNYGMKSNALLVALEHRFFGQSHPFSTLATENLRYLSSEQALADAALFLESHIRKVYPNAGKVISFGGSYPGALSAWFRLKYPHITAGSVASSAPVEAVLDMTSYLDVVDHSLDTLGGPGCDKAVAAATQVVQGMLKTSSGQQQVQTMFNLCTVPSSPKDISNFMSSLMGSWMGTVQYNGQIPNSPTVRDLCATMTSGAQPIDAYLQIWNQFNRGSCVDIRYSEMVKQMQNINDFGENSVGIRSWVYMTCVEFGYFQSTDSQKQPFGDLVPVSFYTGLCTDVYGFKFQPRIKETNIHYGGKSPVGSNVLFVNGGIDPWHSLSVIEPIGDSITAILVPGGSHCENMSPAGPNSPAGMAQAQAETYRQIQGWLNEN
eukprot:TRINITY_DN4186_c0_g1_i1.p1 TRINITY_DN4186_c0_g1~~TRINITY_DN4186_c0_g1_i1.p1  ORF type:complete len:482 (-),score=127.98 TRINITY_DN4186_c0_g1_i1:183-1502(-)